MNRMTPPRKHAPLSAADTEIAGAHAYPCGFETLRTSVYDISSTRASRQIRRLSPPSYVFSISICSTNLLPKPTRCRSFPVGHLATGQSLNQAITPTYSHFRSTTITAVGSISHRRNGPVWVWIIEADDFSAARLRRMAPLGQDPVPVLPCPDPAERAVKMAIATREAAAAA